MTMILTKTYTYRSGLMINF